jgi:hypothetical protein
MARSCWDWWRRWDGKEALVSARDLEKRVGELERLLGLTKRQLTLALCEVARMKAEAMAAAPGRRPVAERGAA